MRGIHITLIDKVADKTQFPSWWVKAITMEYTDCRRIVDIDHFLSIDLNLITESELENNVNSKKVIILPTPLIHNVHEDSFTSERLTSPIFGLGPDIPFTTNYLDAMGEGPLSEYVRHVFDFDELKFGLNKYFQVFDEDRFWQWEFAENKNGQWYSQDVDLRLFNQIIWRIDRLRNNIKKPTDEGFDKFYKMVKFDYHSLCSVRNKILKDLWNVHLKNKGSTDYSKTVNYHPPRLSYFEQFKVEDNEIKTIFFLEPVLFRACVNAVQKAEDLYTKAKSSGNLIRSCDKIYQERVTAIIMGASCIETFIQSVLLEENKKLFGKIENNPLEVKLEVYYTLKSNADLFDLSRDPHQFFTTLKTKRNSLVHFKKEFTDVKNKGTHTRTFLENDLLKRNFINSIPDRVEMFLNRVCSDNDLDVPKWLQNKDSWID